MAKKKRKRYDEALAKIAALRTKIMAKAGEYWHYEGDDGMYVPFTLAVVASNQWKGPPVWPLIIGPPGAGKTDLLMCMQGHDDVITLDKITPNTLVSGYKDRDRQTGEAKDHSILPYLDGRILQLKDFSTVLQMNNTARDEIVTQLRSAYDGQLGAAYGVGGDDEGGIKEIKAHFTVFAACTPIYERFYAVNQQLGERFLQYRFRHINPEQCARKALDNQLSGNPARGKVRKYMHRFLDMVANIPPLKSVHMSTAHREALISIADMVARSRTHIHRDSYKKEVQASASVEVPTRLVIQLIKIAASHAITRGAMSVEDCDVAVAARIAADTIPELRYKLISRLFQVRSRIEATKPFLIKRGSHMVSTKKVADYFKVSEGVMRRHLEDLTLCKICTNNQEERTGWPKYTLADKYQQLLERVPLCRRTRKA